VEPHAAPPAGRRQTLRRRLRRAAAAVTLVNGNPQLRLVAAARAATVTGRWAATVALAVFAYGKGGATAVAVLGVVRILPAALAGPLAAVLLDRVRADRILLLAGVARTVAMFGAGVVALDGGGLAPVFVLIAVESLLSTMVRPLQTASLPFLARSPAELTAANLSLSTIESAGMLVGAALCGALLAVWSPGAVLIATGVSYLVSTVLVARIPAWQQAAAHPEGLSAAAGAAAGIRTIRADPRLRLVVGLYCAENVVTGALNVLVVVSALKLLDIGESGVGLLNSAIGIGGLIGALAAVSLFGRTRIALAFGTGLVLCGLPLIVIGAHPSTVPAIVLLAVLGVGVTIVDYSAITLMQRAIHEDELAKVFSVMQSLFVGSLGLGAALAPLLVSWLGIRGALLASGLVLPVLAGALWRRLVTLDSTVAPADEAIELLRSISIFQPLELPTLERLARSVVSLQVPAGEAIIVEGDHGDRYYVLRDGEVEVREGATPVARLYPGDGFGEIALLRDVPRTATVLATRDSELYALERTAFLDAINGSPSSRSAADAVIELRLGSLRAGLASA
jgi:hypothetical protein